jgi:hypothetical protein
LHNFNKNYPDLNYFCANDTEKDLIAQGDGINHLKIFNAETGESKFSNGIVLSNTCDINSSNKRLVLPHIIFATIINYKSYYDNLNNDQIPKNRLDNHISDLKKQRITNKFYLPDNNIDKTAYIVLFDQIHSLPLDCYLKNKDRKLLFRLSTSGFYAFILKLSIHFCRLSNDIGFRL